VEQFHEVDRAGAPAEQFNLVYLSKESGLGNFRIKTSSQQASNLRIPKTSAAHSTFSRPVAGREGCPSLPTLRQAPSRHPPPGP
jgi:hypothetical protein